MTATYRITTFPLLEVFEFYVNDRGEIYLQKYSRYRLFEDRRKRPRLEGVYDRLNSRDSTLPRPQVINPVIYQVKQQIMQQLKFIE